MFINFGCSAAQSAQFAGTKRGTTTAKTGKPCAEKIPRPQPTSPVDRLRHTLGHRYEPPQPPVMFPLTAAGKPFPGK